MLKVLKIELSNLFTKPLEGAKIEIYPYPTKVYYLQDNRRIYLPSVIAYLTANQWGNAETQLVPNDLLRPSPNFYVVKVMYKGRIYYFVAKITSDMNDIVYLHDVVINKEKECENQQNLPYRVLGNNYYI
ncbi:hypothetical protein YS40_166 [Thermus phage phiYS40]|uniref:hypothetical protein n=1 Tax=Thermus phage phiYS40 TaxID=407392 RepID=UPI0000E68A1C|nr:hypothetical protein YS40_166 [Thermus phage phiYS40]ABJ91560.1 hypothetical protein YS40_166 [Thermus phage phiYS40]BAK53684.1 hypothetical protein YSP_166 [Thermus phage phiYS40]